MFRVDGLEFDVDRYLMVSRFTPNRVYHKGELRGRSGDRYNKSGFSVVVSEADGDDLPRQITEATEFLAANKEEIASLSKSISEGGASLDFGVWQRSEFGYFCYLPPELLMLAGSLGVGIELSVYATEES